MSVTLTDAELVQQALGGSQAAYHALVARYATPAVNLATRMVQDRALAEDLAQEAFVRAFERLATYDQKRRFLAQLAYEMQGESGDQLKEDVALQIPRHVLARRLKKFLRDEGGDPLNKVDAIIHRHVQYVLDLNRGNKLRTARQLHISRSTLYRILANENFLSH